MKEIKNVAIVGMGALGMMYASLIKDALGEGIVKFVLNNERIERYKSRDFTCNGAPFHPEYVNEDEAEPFDLVIVAVKYNSLESALESMKNCIGKDTIIMSVMNGIITESIIGKRYGMDKVISSIVQAVDAMHDAGKLNYTKSGLLCIGAEEGQKEENVNIVDAFLTKAGINHQVEDNIKYRIYCKWMQNVGINQICMVFNTTYGGAVTIPEAYNALVSAMREVILISKAEGLDIGEKELKFYVDTIRTLNPDGCPSMQQDRLAKRKSEVEMFSGTVIKLAEKYGIDVPTNRFLYDQVQKIEAAY